MLHPHYTTGLPCDCSFTAHLRTAKTAGKLHDFLMNPKSRPDLQTPEAQAVLRHLEHMHSDKTDPLMPWLVREWKKGRLIFHQAQGEGEHNGAMYFHHPTADPDEHWSDRLSAGSLEHWGDFLQSNHPLRRELGDIMRHHIGDFAQRVDAWTQDLRSKAQDQAVQAGEVYHTTPDNWTVQRLHTPEQLTAEGEAMGHCVGGYARAVADNQTQIYSLRDPQGRPHATAEIIPKATAYGPWNGPNQGGIVQIQGKEDAVPKHEYQARLKDWFTSFPEEQRPNWASPRGPIEHIGGIMPEAESYHTDSDEMVTGEPTEEGEGGYGPHGDYGIVEPPRRIDYPAVLASLIRPKTYNEWHSLSRGTDVYPMDYDPKEIEALYQEARRRGEIPQLAKVVEQYQEKAQNEFDAMEEHRMNWDPNYYYPGESWDEEPERWEEQVGDPYTGAQTPEEAWQAARGYYDEARDEMYAEHQPSQIASELYRRLNPHWIIGPEGNGSWRNYTEAERKAEQQPGTTPEGTFSKTAAALYQRWVFSPSTGQVELADNTGDPLQVRYHTDLANELNEPGLIHGYAEPIKGGWRLKDWDGKPVEDQFVVARVMRALQTAQKPSGALWEPEPPQDWSRVHHSLPT